MVEGPVLREACRGDVHLADEVIGVLTVLLTLGLQQLPAMT